MFDGSWPGWTLAQSIISAAAGLGGVLAGALLTSRNQREERRHAHIRQQLQEFYSPMLGIKDEINSKHELQSRLQVIANRLATENASRTKSGVLEELAPLYKYNSSQWIEELFPLLKKMSNYFSDHMWLAEQSTRDQYDKLVHVIEVWKRQQASALSPDVLCELKFTGDELKPLYDDLEFHFKRLRGLVQTT
jgi:hypothetical protein